jgi:hypothetical protein
MTRVASIRLGRAPFNPLGRQPAERSHGSAVGYADFEVDGYSRCDMRDFTEILVLPKETA